MNIYDILDTYDSFKTDNNYKDYEELKDEDEREEKEEKRKNKKSMSWKSILFFLIVFGILIFGYYCYDTFLYYFPIHWVFKFFFAIAGLLAILFPMVIQKIKAGYNMDDVKNFMIKKYKRRPHYYQNLNSPIF